MSINDLNRIKHMIEAATEALEFMKDVTYDSLPQDRKTLQAVTRSIEIIGEAAAKLSKEFVNDHPEISWKDIVSMRNWLVHAYFDIDYDHIWNTVHQDLPVLLPLLQNILKSDENK